MRAVVADKYGDPNVLHCRERPVPEPEPDEVTIATNATGVNFADIDKRRGDYPERTDIHTPTPSYIPGDEPAGRVVASGEDAEFEVGDDVVGLLCHESYAEFVTAPTNRVLPIPDGVSYEAAAGIPVQFLTAHNVLHEWGGLEPGETVLINAGAGGVGSAAIQLAARLDCTIYTTASTDEKRAFTREIGADRSIDYTQRSVSSVAQDEVDGGFDLVLDGVGGRVFKQCVKSLAAGGRIISYGIASGRPPTVSTARLLFENQSVLGYHLEHALVNMTERVQSATENVLQAFNANELEVFIDRSFPLEEADRAHEYIESRQNVGKVVLEP